MAAITRWSTGSAVCSAVLRSHSFLLSLSSHSAPLINYGKSTEKIDGIVALMMAMGIISQNKQAPA